jgi:polyribonucleotide nucleotidyltransferase
MAEHHNRDRSFSQTSRWICSSKNRKTVILGTVVSSRKASPGIDFFTTVDYRENLQQQDVFLVVFKRSASSDNEVLTMRLVDRVLRPLFPSDYHAEVQVMIQLMMKMCTRH